MTPRVHLYTVCWDEADMLGFFFRHYDPFVERYVVYDDGSTAGSLDILAAHPRVELRRFERVEAASFVLSHKAMQDEAWKESRDSADWIVVTAIDEHLHLGGGRPMEDYLAAQAEAGVTLVPALGFDMNAPERPDDSGVLVERVTRGRPRIAFNKLSLFRPRALRETGFGPGRHAAEPVGDLRLPARDEVMLWHYKHLGFERNAAREAEQARRLGATDVEKGFGQHYLWGRERLRAFWDEMEATSRDLAAPGFDPAAEAVRPLWWEGRPSMIRVGEARPAPSVPARVLAEPMVSVLIKAHDHAPYVRQSVESVLAQSFQDFEIVVTDDASGDGTLEIVQGFEDPRIRVEAQARNLGISATMNATVGRARGRYLAILNSDDFALPGRLERQVAYLEANASVSLLFGLPRIVDENGAAAAPFNDFLRPLDFPDFSCRSWLREFFFRGNCLCAPTAMIRRDAYGQVGAYDPRLTNLQDLDMWVRMLVAGRTIHVLPEELTAFRIRAGNANMSAPRRDTFMRSAFETTKILERFAALDPEAFEEAFGDALDGEAGAGPDAPVPDRLARLCARDPRTEYRFAAVEHAYRTATDADGYDRLRAVSGSVDALGQEVIWARDGLRAELGRRDAAIAALEGMLTAREADLAGTWATLEDARSGRAAAEAEGRARAGRIAALEADLREAAAAQAASRAAAEGTERDLRTALRLAQDSRERMRRSLSWRSTALLRWVGRKTGL